MSVDANETLPPELVRRMLLQRLESLERSGVRDLVRPAAIADDTIVQPRPTAVSPGSGEPPARLPSLIAPPVAPPVAAPTP
ncbi:MAG TPA: hypothetical protein VF306_23000, partial [Pirellulales bacterium]